MKIPVLLLPLVLLGHTVVLAQTAPPAVCPAPAPMDMSGAAPFGNGTAASCTQAALQALLNAGGNIVCNCGPAPYTLTLTSPLQVPNQRVVLDGLGRLTLSGGGAVRIIDKAPAASAANGTLLALQNLTLRDGFAPDDGNNDRLGGAAIRGRAHGKLQVLNVRFLSNTGPALQSDGCGAVHTIVYDDVVFAGCTFSGNRGANGGAVGTIGSAQRFINCAFEDNAATGTGGTFDLGGIGGAVYVDGVNQNGVTNTMSLCGCAFRRNTAGKQGGAASLIFYDGQGSTASIDRCTFEDNAVGSGGDLGGALYYLSGPLMLTNSTFARNTTPSAGGGVWVTNTLLSVRNCTFASNVAADNAGGGLGGGLAISGGAEHRASVLNCTFSGNRGGNFASALFNLGTLSLGNTLFQNNPTGTGNQSNPYGGGTLNKNSALTVLAGNVQWPETYNAQFGPQREDWLTPAVLVADARLLPLAANGGPTPTQALPAGSPALDLGLAPGAPATDQRGAARVGPPDAGAYEFGSNPLPVMLVAFQAQRRNAATVDLTWCTATEHDNAGFRAERSRSGRENWQVVGMVAGAGNSSAPRNYAWADATAGPAAAYYRLAQVDANGIVTYSPVQAVADVPGPGEGVGLNLYPNPANEVLWLDRPTGAAVAIAELLDATGRVVWRGPAGAGSSALPVQQVPAGLYLVRLQTTTGPPQITRVVVTH